MADDEPIDLGYLSFPPLVDVDTGELVDPLLWDGNRAQTDDGESPLFEE